MNAGIGGQKIKWKRDICHGQDARTRVLQDEILIISFLPTDAPAASSMMAGDVTTLAQRARNNPVKAGSFITKSFLPGAQSRKILCCLWNFVCKQLKGDMAQGLTVHCNVEKHSGRDHCWACLQGLITYSNS